MQKETSLSEKSVQFSIRLYDYYLWLIGEKRDFVIPRQLLRNGTSIGVNLHESIYACSRADFIARLHISLKEASETEYWFILLEQTGRLPVQFQQLKEQCSSLPRMLIAATTTAKRSNNHVKEEQSSTAD